MLTNLTVQQSLALPGCYRRERRGLKPMPRWRNALELQRKGVRDARILCLGHSIVAAFGSTGVAGFSSNEVAFGWPAKLAAKFERGHSQGFFGNGAGSGNAAAFTAYDNRTAAGSWTFYAADANTGFGQHLWITSGPTLWSFTPTIPFDTAEIYALEGRAGGAQSIDVDVDGGTPTNLDLSPTPMKNVVRTFTCALGMHTLNIARSTGEPGITGIVVRDSTQPGVIVVQAARQGSTTGNLLANPNAWGWQTHFQHFAPDLTIIQYACNERAITVSQSRTNHDAIVRVAKQYGDVVLMIDNPASTLESERTPRYDEIHSVAEMHGLNVIDLNTHLDRNFARANARGWYVDGALHPGPVGFTEIADLVFELVR